MSEETPSIEHQHTPSCCRREPDPTQHPNWIAWLEDARAKMASGVEETQIEAFCGEPVAVVKAS